MREDRFRRQKTEGVVDARVRGVIGEHFPDQSDFSGVLGDVRLDGKIRLLVQGAECGEESGRARGGKSRCYDG